MSRPSRLSELSRELRGFLEASGMGPGMGGGGGTGPGTGGGTGPGGGPGVGGGHDAGSPPANAPGSVKTRPPGHSLIGYGAGCWHDPRCPGPKCPCKGYKRVPRDPAAQVKEMAAPGTTPEVPAFLRKLVYREPRKRLGLGETTVELPHQRGPDVAIRRPLRPGVEPDQPPAFEKKASQKIGPCPEGSNCQWCPRRWQECPWRKGPPHELQGFDPGKLDPFDKY